MSKLTKATAGPFQLTTDGFDGYPAAVFMHLAHRVDYAMLIKDRPGRGGGAAVLTAADNRQQAQVREPLPRS
jgi:hypothetical protein